VSEASPNPSPLAGEGPRRAAARGRGEWEHPAPYEIRKRAKAMRSAPTDAERALWRILRAKRLASYKFKRQLPIDSYIVDFVCLGRRLIVEADGSQHCEGTDAARDRHLRRQRFRIERYWNNDILNEPEKVTTAILNALEECEASRDSPLPPTASRRAPPSPARGEGF